MLCQQCKQNEATTHIRRVSNGTAEELHLCAVCANSAGVAVGFSGLHLSDLFGNFLGTSPELIAAPPAKRCGFCGSSLREITREGGVGCAECYTTFYDQLAPTLQRVHGALRHAGKQPNADPTVAAQRQKEAALQALRDEIQAAVQIEDYEHAAELRDRMRKIEEGGGEP